MFDPTPASSEPRILSEHTLGGPDHPHPVQVPSLPDTGALLAEAGLPSHAIREILGSAAGSGAHG